MLNRRATTLAELLVALTLAGAVLGTATASVLRQQRTAMRLGAESAVGDQLHAGNALAIAQVAMLSARAGDLVAGQASDTALQLRVTIASGSPCAPATVSVVLPADAQAVLPTVGWAGPAHRGDTLWWFGEADTLWHPREVQAVSSSAAGCAGARGSVLSLGGSDSIPANAPVRITRPARITVYRAGDGSWQLGERELSETTGQLAAVQPVAGPFVRALPSGERTGFRYFSAADVELQPPLDSQAIRRVARIRLTVIAARRDTTAGVPLSRATVRMDSAEVSVRGGAGSTSP